MTTRTARGGWPENARVMIQICVARSAAYWKVEMYSCAMEQRVRLKDQKTNGRYVCVTFATTLKNLENNQ